MVTKVKTSMIDGDFGGEILNSPITIVAAGQSNMVGWTGANNGPLFSMSSVSIWDRGTQTFRNADLSSNTYVVYSGDGNPANYIGGGRNNLAVAFAYRLSRETGRSVRIIFNATGARNSSFWVGNGRNSTDWLALLSDISASGVTNIDYFLWQQGEEDAITNKTVGVYTAVLDKLRTQAMAESWWKDDTALLIGKPSQQWADTASRDYLVSEIDAFSNIVYRNVGIAQQGSPFFRDSVYPGVTGDLIHFTGRSLYSLGYYNYWQAVPSWKAPDKKDFSEEYKEFPYPSTAYPTDTPLPNYQTQNRRPPLYNLEPSIAITGNRMWVSYTSNATSAGEGAGQFAKLSFTDLVSGAPTGTWTGQGASPNNAVDFIGPNPAVVKLWVDPEGALHVFMLASNNSAVWDGIGGVWHSVCRFPSAEFPRFTVPKRLVNYGVVNRPFKIGGKWYLPVSYWRLTNGGGNSCFVPALGGRWYFEWDYAAGEILNGFAGGPETSNNTYDEQCIHLRSAGGVRASFRTLNGAYISDNNSGDFFSPSSWSTPVAWTALGTNPASRHCAINTTSGRMAVAFNASAARDNLTLGLSSSNTDLPLTYTTVLQAGASAYPDIHQSGDTFWVAYDAGSNRGSTRLIRVARVLESAMIAGTATVTTYTVDTGS